MNADTLNVLVDLACNLGHTTRLAKILKNAGIDFRITSYDTLRVREKVFLSKSFEDAANKVLQVFDQIKNSKDLWNTACVEVWIESSSDHMVKPSIIKYDELCIYVRRGAKSKIVFKIAWIEPCKQVAGEPIPESITRFCFSDPNTITSIKNIVLKFTGSLQPVREYVMRSSCGEREIC
ncbi:MAG: hypothetical protein QW425_00050 [Desulfurococcaceae archaeon]